MAPSGVDGGIQIHVARTRHPHDRVQQQDTIIRGAGSFGQLLMDPVQRIASLESDDVGVAKFGQPGPGFGRGQPQLLKIVAGRCLQHFERAGNVALAPTVHFRHQRVT